MVKNDSPAKAMRDIMTFGLGLFLMVFAMGLGMVTDMSSIIHWLAVAIGFMGAIFVIVIGVKTFVLE